MTDEARRVWHGERPPVMQEGAEGECHFCGCTIRMKTEMYRGRRRITIQSKAKRRGIGNKRTRWEIHKCPVARKRAREHKAAGLR